MEYDWKTLLFMSQFFVNVFIIWWLRHNIIDLWQQFEDLKERYHALDKGKLTRGNKIIRPGE